MTSRRVAALLVCLAALFAVLPAGPADATARTFPGVDCTDPPTPDMPGEGLPAFFEKTPNPLPEPGDPFAKGSRTTIYEQYGYAGLRWHTYDLGCGPDAARNPDAVIGTAMSNWLIDIPVSVSALTTSVTDVKPSVSVASNVQESIFYRGWLAGTLGSTDSRTAEKYGPRLFAAQALTWREAYVVQHDPQRGKAIIEGKQDEWRSVASQIKADDPSAYEHLTGRRSDTRIGYAVLSTLAALLALPFLLVAALMLLGSFLVVRLAVMMFPAFAVLGVFPAGRGLVVGIGRTVGAALVNAVVFGVGAAVTIRVLGLILDPATRIPGWLALVLMPLFGFIMWVALKPFRRLTSMLPRADADPFAEGIGALGGATRSAGSWARRAIGTGVAVYSGNVAAAATVGSAGRQHGADVPDRVEARPVQEPPVARTPLPPHTQPPALEPVRITDRTRPEYDMPPPALVETELAAVEPEWVDGDEVFTVYRPEGSTDAA